VQSYKEQQKQTNARQKKSKIILRLMKMDHLEDYDLDCVDCNIGREVFNWLLTRPKTDGFKILDFFDSDFESLSSKTTEKGIVYILIMFEGQKYMLEAEVMVINQQLFLNTCVVHTTTQTKFVERIGQLKTKMFSEFIRSFDTCDNIIVMGSKGLQTRSRIGFNYDIYQFDVEKFKTEIKNAIIKNKKRGYILVGPPGVGKSTVIVKLEKEITHIPIVYITASANVFREDLAHNFAFLRSISPCLAIFEDLDTYKLTYKQDSIFGDFIEQLDSLKYQESIIVIATLNDPRAIHSSLINRRGRFDKVFFMSYPTDIKEIVNVLDNKYKKETGQDFPVRELDPKTIQKIIDNHFSHSDLCEVIDNMVINDISITNENIDKGVDEVIKTMDAIQKCSLTAQSSNRFIQDENHPYVVDGYNYGRDR